MRETDNMISFRWLLTYSTQVKGAPDPSQNTTTEELRRQAHPEQDPVRWRAPPRWGRTPSIWMSLQPWAVLAGELYTVREAKWNPGLSPNQHMASFPHRNDTLGGPLPFFSVNKSELTSHYRNRKTQASFDSFLSSHEKNIKQVKSVKFNVSQKQQRKIWKGLGDTNL